MTTAPVFAPGTRIVVRDAEWMIRKVDRSSTGDQALTCIGLSQLVKDQEAIFLRDLEDDIEVVDPKRTKLVPDNSSAYAAALLHMEAQLRQTVPTGQHIHRGHRAAMDSVPYQLDPALLALEQPRQRILIADTVGLGKTLEAGILLSELIARGKAKRILVVAVKSMLTQFQKELWTRFTIPLMRLDSAAIRRVRNDIPTNQNPFHYYDKTIVSIDTLKQSREYRVHLEEAYWDVIVIDEAHNVAERGGGISQRARLARLLAQRSDALIMLSATPHDGRAKSFASLMNMLDPTAIVDPENYGPEDIRGLYIRRFKKDIQHQVTQAFQQRTITAHRFPASGLEEIAFESLAAVTFTRIDQRKTPGQLFRITLEKALFSSPAACLETIDHRLQSQAKANDPALASDMATLRQLRDDVAAIGIEGFSKYQALLDVIRGDHGWNGKDRTDRLVIFTERIATLNFLHKHLPKALGLKEKHVAVLHGALGDLAQQRIVEAFGQEEAPVRLLLASDVASEGINLHYLSHRMIHFDIPWSLMVFQQRNGRIDRYGQTKPPHITYLLTESGQDRIHGDLRILELLIQKDQQAYENIGDPLVIGDPEAQAAQTAEAIGQQLSPEAYNQELDEGLNPLDILFSQATPETQMPAEPIASRSSLFPSDFHFVTSALRFLSKQAAESATRKPLRFSVDEDERFVELNAPEDLQHRFRYFPTEIRPKDFIFKLSASKDAIQEAVKQARKSEETWPDLHYLWEQHPAVTWLCDKVSNAFGRLEAPVIVPGDRLSADESLFLIAGLIPNRKGHPLISKWIGVRFFGDHFANVFNWEEVLELTQIHREALPNRGADLPLKRLQRLLPEAIQKATYEFRELRHRFETDNQPKLQEHLERLAALRDKKEHLLQLRFEDLNQPEAIVQARRDREERNLAQLFNDFQAWIHDTMSSEDQPYIHVVAVFCGEGGDP